MADYAVMPIGDYQDACDAIREKDGSTEVIKSGDMGDKIRAIETGVELPVLSNPAGAANIQSGYEAVDGEGKKITGTHTEKTLTDLLPAMSNPAGAANIESGYQGVNSAGKVVTGTAVIPNYEGFYTIASDDFSILSIYDKSLELYYPLSYSGSGNISTGSLKFFGGYSYGKNSNVSDRIVYDGKEYYLTTKNGMNISDAGGYSIGAYTANPSNKKLIFSNGSNSSVYVRFIAFYILYKKE